MNASDARRRRLVEVVRGEIRRATGRGYEIDLDALDERSLQELLRMLRDLDGERRAAVQRARVFPWLRCCAP